MKEKKNKYIKTNIIGFVIAMVIVSGLAVYAAVTFPSNDVSYDNSTSNLQSSNVQGAIDELYKTCTATLGEQILEKVDLEKDPYECRYFFTGANPNNYITFNNETAGWRIISVECDGTIKIMKTDSIGNRAWDASISNNWSRPATTNTYLNGTYYNSLTSTAQGQIVDKDYSIGAVTDGNNDLADQIDDENSIKWNGKIALPTVSEYLRTNSDKSKCGTFSLTDNSYACRNTTWMYITYFWWTLTPRSGDSYNVFYVDSYGMFYQADTSINGEIAVRPTLYLSSSVKITGGDGSQSNPYTIE